GPPNDASSPPRIRRTLTTSPISRASAEQKGRVGGVTTSGLEPPKRSMTDRAVKVRLIDGVVLMSGLANHRLEHSENDIRVVVSAPKSAKRGILFHDLEANAA